MTEQFDLVALEKALSKKEKVKKGPAKQAAKRAIKKAG